MGLDFSIEVDFKNKKTGESLTFEMAYWRKFWTLRDEVLRLFDQSTDEYLTIIKPEDLRKIIKLLADAITDRDSEIFHDSIWGGNVGRRITVHQIERLCFWDSLFESLLWIKEDEAHREQIIDDLEIDIERYEYDASSEDLEHVLMSIEDYDFTIRIENSY